MFQDYLYKPKSNPTTTLPAVAATTLPTTTAAKTPSSPSTTSTFRPTTPKKKIQSTQKLLETTSEKVFVLSTQTSTLQTTTKEPIASLKTYADTTAAKVSTSNLLVAREEILMKDVMDPCSSYNCTPYFSPGPWCTKFVKLENDINCFLVIILFLSQKKLTLAEAVLT